MKVLKKNVSIEKTKVGKKVVSRNAYYTFEDGECYFIRRYYGEFTDKEIRDEVVELVKEHFC